MPDNAIQAVIFDFDGTLVDSMGVWTDIDIEFFGKYNLPLNQETSQAITVLGFEGGAHYVRYDLGLDKPEHDIIEEWNSMASDHYANDVYFKRGVRTFVDDLSHRNMPMGIATSNRESLVLPALENNNATGLFSPIVYSNDLGLEKSDPKVYLHAAHLMGQDPSETLVFEDTAVPAQAAKQGGFTVVGVRDDHLQQNADALRDASDYFIESFDELVPGTELYDRLLGQ